MKRIFFKNVRIVDGDGNPAIENGCLVVNAPNKTSENSSILYVGTAEGCQLVPEEGDQEISAEGYTILPGMFNVHVHLRATNPRYQFKCDPYGTPYRTLIYYRHLMEALPAGITTIRGCGDSHGIDLAIRKALGKKMLWGPRLVTCGKAILPDGGHAHHQLGSVECSGPAEFMKAVRTEIGEGVDQIKLFYSGGASDAAGANMFTSHITDEEGKAACEVAHMHHKKVAAHLSNDVAIQSAIRAGVDSLEHCYFMNDETVQMIVDNDRWLTPTLTVTDVDNSDPGWLGGISEFVVQRLRDVHKLHMESCTRAIKAGVKKICTGTDTLPTDKFGGTWATTRECELLVEAGLTPVEAIKAATGNSADLCELTNVTGRLKEGLCGDILAVKGKPDQNISDLRNLDMVMRDGRIVFSKIPSHEQALAMVPIEWPEEDLNGTKTAW